MTSDWIGYQGVAGLVNLDTTSLTLNGVTDSILGVRDSTIQPVSATTPLTLIYDVTGQRYRLGMLGGLTGQILVGITGGNPVWADAGAYTVVNITATVSTFNITVPSPGVYNLNFASQVVFPGTISCDNGIFMVPGTEGVIKRLSTGKLELAIPGTDYQSPITLGTTAQYLRGDQSLATLNQAAVAGLRTSDNVEFTNLKLSGLSAAQGRVVITDAAGNLLTTSAPPASTAFLQNDLTWQYAVKSITTVPTQMTFIPQSSGAALLYFTSTVVFPGDVQVPGMCSIGSTLYLGTPSSAALLKRLATTGQVTDAVPGTDYQVPIATGTTAQYIRGNGSLATLNQAAVAGLTTADSPSFAGLTSGNTSVGALTASGSVTFSSYTANRLLSTGTGGLVTVLASGTSGQYLRGDLTWATYTAAGVTSITGTTNQVIASAPTGAVTLSLPQSIGTGNSPQFTGLGLSTAAASDRVLNLGGVSPGSGNAFGIVQGGFLGSLSTTGNAYGYYSSPTYNTPASMTGNVYGVYIDTGAKTGSGTPNYSYGLFCTAPNVSSTYGVGAYIESMAVGTGAWTTKTNADGYAYILRGIGVGGQPATDRCAHIASARQYNTYSSQYPASSSGSTDWFHHYLYYNLGALSGGSATLYGFYVPGGGTPNANVAASYGGYFGNGNWASSSTNSYALYAADISVGATGSKVANGIYSQGGIRLGSGTEALTKYGTLQTSGGSLTFGGGTIASWNPVYQRVGNFVTVTWPQTTLTGANNTSQLAINSTAFGAGSQYLSNATDCYTLIPAFNAGSNTVCRVRVVKSGTTMDLQFATFPSINNWAGFAGVDPIIYAGSLTYQAI